MEYNMFISFIKNGLVIHDFHKNYNRLFLESDRQLYRIIKTEFHSKKMYNIWEPLKINPTILMSREIGNKKIY